MDPDDLISFSGAAREIGCSRTTLYRTANDGRLNDVEVGGRRMLLKDEAWEDFEPIRTGARAQKRVRRRRIGVTENAPSRLSN
jgi:excisionase family DNA binding protein